MTAQFSGFIEGSAKATSTEEVFLSLCQAVSPIGYDWIAFFALTMEARYALVPPGSEVASLLASNYPDKYLRRYMQKVGYDIDPVLLLARESLTPLLWEDVVNGTTLSEEQILLSAERRNSGLYNGVTCPVHGPGEQVFAVCFARSCPREQGPAHLSALQVLAIHFYYAFARVHQARTHPANTQTGLADGPPMSLTGGCVLTHRERECLLWTARGKSASSISVILGLSENTVNFYVKNAMRQLGTTNRVVAVVLAVRAGIIKP